MVPESAAGAKPRARRGWREIESRRVEAARAAHASRAARRGRARPPRSRTSRRNDAASAASARPIPRLQARSASRATHAEPGCVRRSVLAVILKHATDWVSTSPTSRRGRRGGRRAAHTCSHRAAWMALGASTRWRTTRRATRSPPRTPSPRAHLHQLVDRRAACSRSATTWRRPCLARRRSRPRRRRRATPGDVCTPAIGRARRRRTRSRAAAKQALLEEPSTLLRLTMELGERAHERWAAMYRAAGVGVAAVGAYQSIRKVGRPRGSRRAAACSSAAYASRRLRAPTSGGGRRTLSSRQRW